LEAANSGMVLDRFINVELGNHVSKVPKGS
jgi:hypothetical protein